MGVAPCPRWTRFVQTASELWIQGWFFVLGYGKLDVCCLISVLIECVCIAISALHPERGYDFLYFEYISALRERPLACSSNNNNKNSNV